MIKHLKNIYEVKCSNCFYKYPHWKKQENSQKFEDISWANTTTCPSCNSKGTFNIFLKK